jgi:small-conductance mechanosensitive channel
MDITAAITSSGVMGVVLAQGPKPEQVAQIVEKVEFFDTTKLLVAGTLTIAGFLLSRLVRQTLDKLGEGNARRRLTMKKVTSFTRIAIFTVTAYLVVMTFFDAQEDRTALLGLGGTLAVALGFALKDVSSSLMAGILILIDQPFQVGDRVAFNQTYGEVTEIGLRAVRIVTLDDNEVSIPNNKFLTEVVSSANAGALDMMVVMDFHIAATEDFELAKRIIYEACTTSKYVFLEKPVRVLIEENVRDGVVCTRLRCKAYVIDTRYEKDFVTDVTERVKRAFRKHRIGYPYERRSSVSTTDEEYIISEKRDRSTFGEPEPEGEVGARPSADGSEARSERIHRS